MEIQFGAMAPKLTEQIPDLDEKYEKANYAITFLFLHGLLSDSETYKARRKLVKMIESDFDKR